MLEAIEDKTGTMDKFVSHLIWPRSFKLPTKFKHEIDADEGDQSPEGKADDKVEDPPASPTSVLHSNTIEGQTVGENELSGEF